MSEQNAHVPEPEIILRARGVRKSFRMGETSVMVLKSVDLTVRRGEFIAIEGRSGSGKSTLLHIIGALEAPDDGTLQFEDKDYTRHPPRSSLFVRLLVSRWWWHIDWISLLVTVASWAVLIFAPFNYAPLFHIAIVDLFLLSIAVTVVGLIIRAVRQVRDDRIAAPLRNRDFGFVFQFYHLLPELNVLQNTMLAPMIEHSWFKFKSKKRDLRKRAEQILSDLGLAHRLKHRPNQLSGGERQRVAIARALMNSPKVLFADEPTGNLDAETGRQIMNVLEKLHQEQGQTILMVTHDRTLAREADRVLLLKDGRLTAEDPASIVSGQ